MFTFEKYPSISLANRVDVIDKFNNNGVTAGKFEVTEKLDGANYSYWCDGSEVWIAARNHFISSGEDFFNHQKVDSVLLPEVKKLYNHLKLLNNQEKLMMIVYGELYGEGIKSKIKYGNTPKSFAVFDIKVNGEFLPTSDVEHFCDLFEFEHVPIIKRECSFDDAMAIHNVFNTAIGSSDTESEGVVIKPNKPLFLTCGKRVILKNKNNNFLERAHKASGSQKVKKLTEPMDPLDLEILNALSEYINENRVYSAISKIGEISANDFPKLTAEVMHDAMEDFIDDHSECNLLNQRSKSSRKRINKEFFKLINSVVRPIYLKLISD